jgi:hypothetical protein
MRGAVRTACCSAIVVLALCATTVPARSDGYIKVVLDPNASR